MSEYSSKSNCAYQTLQTYYKGCGIVNSNLFSSTNGSSQPPIRVQSVFGGTPYSFSKASSDACGLGRISECCDGRTRLENAYPNQGVCSQYYANQCSGK
jgi:hypothetical protein